MKCANPQCGNAARRNKDGSVCSRACQRIVERLRRTALMKEMVVRGKCALPGCDNTARAPRPNSCCCDDHIKQLKLVRKKQQEALAKVVQDNQLSQKPYGRDQEQLQRNTPALNYIPRERREKITGLELALVRAEAIAIASRQPGYNRKDAADIKRRVDDILDYWRMQ